MKSLKSKLGLSFISRRTRRAIKDFKTSIKPTRILYLWEKNNLMKIEMFSMD
ncbi:MAG: hypothetical protein Fur0012_01740 [Elusimicrobiota bacterium]